jgi:hypothetical protein
MGDASAAQPVLDAADEAIRRARDQSSDWWEGRRTFAEWAPRLIAEAVVSAQGSAHDGDGTGVIEEVLLGRGRAAHELITRLQDILARALEALARAAPLAHADPSSIRDFPVGGLPPLKIDGIRGEDSLHRPWWTGIAPSLAVRATERRIWERFGRSIPDAVEFYDRNLESWVKAKLARLVELYEAQAGAFREQIRRLTVEVGDADMAGDAQDLAADLRELGQEANHSGVGVGAPATDRINHR